ncbi:MAG: DUF1570 domain-containing protein [Pirellulaceae bacterium]|nr:DUF1570 domain-containing protein [Pirellulaceae bacterium]
MNRTNSIRRSVLAAAWLLLAFLPSVVTAQTTALVEFFSSGKTQQGLALVDFAHEMIVLGRDGRLHSLDPSVDDNIRRFKGRYEPTSAAELRNELRAEFGSRFDVVATQNFLVVQPSGRDDRWPRLFEQAHRSFSTYMSKRGVKVRNGRFPMVAVVYPDQEAMYAEFKRQKIDVSRVAGIYSNDSNRVMTHDGGHLSIIASTVRHEAAHQSAFNSGVHSRVTDTPKWITEGIGQMFESPAMTSRKAGSNVRDRSNADSIHVIKSQLSGRNELKFYQSVVQLIGDDELFSDDKTIDNAYAVSWAMMFYLAERQPKEFARLLNYTATRPPFRLYEKTERIKDFERIVGVEMFEFSKRVQWFMKSL